MNMKLDYVLSSNEDYYFDQSLTYVMNNNLGLFYFNKEVYLPHCGYLFYFLNVTEYIYERKYKVYTFGDFSDQTKFQYLTKLTFNLENLLKKE